MISPTAITFARTTRSVVAMSGLMVVGLALASCAGAGTAAGGPRDDTRSAAGTAGAVANAPLIKLKLTQGSTQYDSVRCGVQDRAGALWFGTTGEGVYRYDGKEFTQFCVRDGLSSNTAWSILADKEDRIWIGTDLGLCVWDGQRMLRVDLPILPAAMGDGAEGAAGRKPGDVGAAPQAVWSLLQDSKGTIWIGGAEGMYCWRDGKVTPFLASAAVQNPLGLHLRMVDDTAEDRKGNIWFGSGMPPGLEGLCRFDGTVVTQFNPGGENWIRTIKEGQDGTLWLGTRHVGPWRYDGTEMRAHNATGLPLGEPRLVDRAGSVWFGGVEGDNGASSRSGIWRFDGSGYRNFSSKEGLGAWYVWCIIEDRAGNIWVGTRNTGLYRYDGKTFTSFSN